MSALQDKQDRYISLKSYAKVNLHLRITGKRADGYHTLESLICPVDLFDELDFYFSEPGLSLRVKSDKWPLSEGEDNLVMRAARLFFKLSGIAPALSIVLKKNIPVGAGLGGGSSNAALVLRVLNSFYDGILSEEQLFSMALSLGADLPFFLGEGGALARGIGEILESRDIKPYFLVLVKPDKMLSTAEVYKNLKWGLTKETIKIKKPHFEGMLIDPLFYLHNDLEPAAKVICKEIDEAYFQLFNSGAEGVLMSGSGPSVFGLFSSSAAAYKAASLISGLYSEWFVYPSCLLP